MNCTNQQQQQQQHYQWIGCCVSFGPKTFCRRNEMNYSVPMFHAQHIESTLSTATDCLPHANHFSKIYFPAIHTRSWESSLPFVQCVQSAFRLWCGLPYGNCVRIDIVSCAKGATDDIVENDALRYCVRVIPLHLLENSRILPFMTEIRSEYTSLVMRDAPRPSDTRASIPKVRMKSGFLVKYWDVRNGHLLLVCHRFSAIVSLCSSMYRDEMRRNMCVIAIDA